jgi:hypothetical protein
MNRVLTIGIAVFFAIVGLALLGGENKAQAGHGCHGCDGCHACDGCHSRRCDGCHSRRERCHGRCHGCDGCHASHGCCGGSPAKADDGKKKDGDKGKAPEGGDKDKKAASVERTPMSYYTVSFRR